MMLLLVLLFSFHATTNVVYCDDETKTTDQVIRDNGYPAEKHWVMTEDGYWLRLHRIPYGKNRNATNGTREVFFVQHGLTESSSHFVVNRDCIAFTLADAGYDVWLGNTRGNEYSQAHAFHKNDSAEFWDFSFDEMAKYDVPAMIDYALKNTSTDSLWYVGHSQGTMIMFAKLSEDVDFQQKIKGFFAMAPVAKLDTVFKPIKIASKIFYGLKWVMDQSNVRHIPLPYHLLKKVIHAFCILGIGCDAAYAEVHKYDAEYIDWSKLPDFLAALFTKGDASVKNIYHYAQLMETGKFQKYDYGMPGNIMEYWQTTPPEYHLTNIETSVWLFSGTKDILASRDDVVWINTQLKKVEKNIILKGYNHLHFLWGKTVKRDIYDNIIKFARTHSATSRRKRN